MRVNDINKVKPAKDNVVVQNIELDTTNELFFDKADHNDLKNAVTSYGKVISTGPTAGEDTHAPGVKAGDSVVYNTYAGSHIATSKINELYKIMGGYSIMAKLDDINKLEESTIHPISNRLLIKVKFADETDDGLFLDKDDAADPRLEDIDFGEILKVGSACKLGYKVGDLVAYNPYSGENVRPPISEKEPGLRVIIEEDVLLTI